MRRLLVVVIVLLIGRYDVHQYLRSQMKVTITRGGHVIWAGNANIRDAELVLENGRFTRLPKHAPP